MASANKQCEREVSISWIANNPDEAYGLILSLQGEIKQKNQMLKEATIARKQGRRIHQLRKES